MSKDSAARAGKEGANRQPPRREKAAAHEPQGPQPLQPDRLLDLPDSTGAGALRQRAITQLQRSGGNRAVGRRLRAAQARVQRVGPDGDEATAESDAAAGPAAMTLEEQRALYRQAEAAYQAGDYRQAVALFNRLLRDPGLDPSARGDILHNTNMAARRLLTEAVAAGEEGDYLQSAEIFRFMLDQPGVDPEGAAFLREQMLEANRGLFRQAFDAYEAGDFAGALARFDALLQDQNLPEAVRTDLLYNRGRALQELGRHEEALADLEVYAARAGTPEARAAVQARIDQSLTALIRQEEAEGGAGAESAGPEGRPAGTTASAGGTGPATEEGADPAAHFRQGMDHYHAADYWAAIPLLEQVRDSRGATDRQRLEAQLYIGLAYHAVAAHTFAAHNMRRYLRMPGADPALVERQLAESERENQRAARSR